MDLKSQKKLLKDILFLKLTRLFKLLYIEWDYQNPV